MRIAYALGEDDLAAVLMQQTLWRRDRVRAWFERIRTGPVWRHLMVNVGPGALFGLMLYPVWLWQVRGSCPRSAVGGIYVGALAIAVVLGTALQRWRAPPRLRFKAVHRWSARRRLERAAPRLSRRRCSSAGAAVAATVLDRKSIAGCLRASSTSCAMVASISRRSLSDRARKSSLPPARAQTTRSEDASNRA